ncbi:hypothetical protein [Maribacter sp. 2-571]|uniref:hypothetical protein n=1 Tax=Maribacter sp. 2-571 TaxID=3417569 RepID=UPI003D349475
MNSNGTFSLNSFRLFRLKRKLSILRPVEDFFEFHSRATGGKKDKNRAVKGNFLAN